ncbi:MAG: GDP-mannose 4,6-dehydratase [Actinobacteria bacterium]|nr:GDP-mannose 4,6-dehydratase [Actinomycetota bacterium]
MRALVTGSAGQDGYLLSKSLLKRGWDVTGSKLKHEILISSHPLSSGQVVDLDVSDAVSVENLIGQLKPDVIYHLAGITSVGFSIKEPELTKSVNVGGTRNILESVLKQGLSDALVVHAASTEIFSDQGGVISETSDLGPRSPYGESKAEAFELCHTYRARGVKATNAILANHESFLRPVEFVTGKIANGVARISLGQASELILGNTDVAKDWSAATDIVEGLALIGEQSFVGDVILANGVSTRLQDIIKEAFAYVGILNWKDYVKSDVALVRDGESKSIQIDPAKALAELGWKAETPTSKWVGEMVQHHLDQLSSSN